MLELLGGAHNLEPTQASHMKAPRIWEQHPIKDRYKEEVFKGFFREALASGGALIVMDSNVLRFAGFEPHNQVLRNWNAPLP